MLALTHISPRYAGGAGARGGERRVRERDRAARLRPRRDPVPRARRARAHQGVGPPARARAGRSAADSDPSGGVRWSLREIRPTYADGKRSRRPWTLTSLPQAGQRSGASVRRPSGRRRAGRRNAHRPRRQAAPSSCRFCPCPVQAKRQCASPRRTSCGGPQASRSRSTCSGELGIPALGADELAGEVAHARERVARVVVEGDVLAEEQRVARPRAGSPARRARARRRPSAEIARMSLPYACERSGVT